MQKHQLNQCGRVPSKLCVPLECTTHLGKRPWSPDIASVTGALNCSPWKPLINLFRSVRTCAQGQRLSGMNAPKKTLTNAAAKKFDGSHALAHRLRLSIKLYWNMAVLACVGVGWGLPPLSSRVEKRQPGLHGPESPGRLPSGPRKKRFASVCHVFESSAAAHGGGSRGTGGVS